MSEKFHRAWRYDGQAFKDIHKVAETVQDFPHLGVTANQCRRPCVCDGYEVCVHSMDRGNRTPHWPVFSCETEKEALEVAKLLRRCCEAWQAEGLAEDAHPGDDITERLEKIARRLGYRRDHHIVWHKSLDWLALPSHTEGKLWGDTAIGELARAVQ
jgi:hypothetical protein